MRTRMSFHTAIRWMKRALVAASEAKLNKLKTFFSVDPMTRLDILVRCAKIKRYKAKL